MMIYYQINDYRTHPILLPTAPADTSSSTTMVKIGGGSSNNLRAKIDNNQQQPGTVQHANIFPLLTPPSSSSTLF